MSALSSLLSQSAPDPSAVLAAADTQLGNSTSDLETLHIKLIALLQLERYDDARDLFRKVGAPLQDRASLEWAYVLYKDKSPDAISVAEKGSSRGHRHVLAQAAYTLEDFHKAHRTYQDILDNAPEHEQLDVKVNVLAANVQALLAGQGGTLSSIDVQSLHDDASEVYYNAACASIAAGDLSRAEEQLQRSQDLLKANRELSEEDKNADLLSIRVQQVCVLERLGRKTEAKGILSSLQSEEISDSVLQHIVSLDSVILNAGDNPFQTRQDIETRVSRAVASPSLFDFQKDTLDRNRLVAHLETHQPNAVHKAANRALKDHAQPTTDYKINSLSVLDAAATAGSQPAKKAIKSLLPVAAKRPNDLGLLLVLIQLYASTNNLAAAIACLESFNLRQEKTGSPEGLAARYSPGLVALSAALYEARNQTEKRRSELAKAVTFWRAQQDQQSPLAAQNAVVLDDLFKTAGYALLSSPQMKEQRLAADIFGALYDKDSRDSYVAAGLCASVDERTLPLASKPEELIKDLDIDALLRAGIATAPVLKSRLKSKLKSKSKSKPKSNPKSKTQSTKSTSQSNPSKSSIKSTGPKPATNTASSSSTNNDNKSSRPAKRIKPSRLPKTFDASKTPDPERWLPLRDRSTYRPAKGNKKKLAARLRREMASQGTAGGAGSAGGVGGAGSGAGGSGVGSGLESAGGSRPGTPGVGAKKKKKGGKR